MDASPDPNLNRVDHAQPIAHHVGLHMHGDEVNALYECEAGMLPKGILSSSFKLGPDTGTLFGETPFHLPDRHTLLRDHFREANDLLASIA